MLFIFNQTVVYEAGKMFAEPANKTTLACDTCQCVDCILYHTRPFNAVL